MGENDFSSILTFQFSSYFYNYTIECSNFQIISPKQVSNLFGLNMIHFIVLSHHRSLAGMARPKDCWAGRIA